MTDFEKKRLVKKPTDSGSQASATNQRWREIRERSVLDFVNRVAKGMSGEGDQARQDKALRAGLYAMVLHDGQAFAWQGMTVDERMALGEWAKTFRPSDDDDWQPFATRAEWDGFCEAMRKLRDPSEPMLGREHLLAIGEGIEARQLEHAQRMGWLGT